MCRLLLRRQLRLHLAYLVSQIPPTGARDLPSAISLPNLDSPSAISLVVGKSLDIPILDLPSGTTDLHATVLEAADPCACPWPWLVLDAIFPRDRFVCCVEVSDAVSRAAAGLAHGDADDDAETAGTGGVEDADDLARGAVVSVVDRRRDEEDEMGTGEAEGRPDY